MELRKIMPKKIVPSDKRGMGINDIYPIMLTICVTAILIAIVLFILQEFNTQMTDNGTTNGTAASNATDDIIEDIADFVPWIGIILLVVAAAIVIGVLIRNLAGGSRV